MQKKENACRELLNKIRSGMIKSQDALEKEKVNISRKYNLDFVIRNSDIAELTRDRRVKKLLKTKPVRTLSGVANIAVMWSPGIKDKSCPGSCIYCPQGTVKSKQLGTRQFVPKSYTGCEPATLRAIRTGYDPYMQVANRIKQLSLIGHPTDKCELIIMGGTFMFWARKKQEHFVKRCFDAFNGKNSRTLKEAQQLNEKAQNRCIGLTIETRADYCKPSDIRQMLKLGCTRVEIGVQTTDDRLLRKIKRGHTMKENIAAIKRLKRAGLKVCIHWMPGLTGLDKLDIEKEVVMFRLLFSDPSYRPDELKIYPTLVLEGTELYELWRKGEYEPLTIDQMAELLVSLKQEVPQYVRIKRVMRDISEKGVVAGPKTTNLRQLVSKKMAEKGIACKCIRCREVGMSKVGKIRLFRIEYNASGGKEIFLSFESSSLLVAFLRLRIDDKTAKVRELHVYGQVVPIKAMTKGYQHKGYGKRLLEKAEKTAKAFGCKKIRVTSGVGVRDYYRKLGYELEGYYMCKGL